MIRLPVYIFKSRSAEPAKDPIIYTVGGPGASTMPSAQYMAYYKYLDDRDFILLEQRGTAYAKPALNCEAWAQAAHLANLPDTDPLAIDSLFTDAAQQCREHLVRQGIDLDGYRTTEIAADIADLKAVLNLESYNLLTISYSTKIAQVLLRDFPEGIRSVVMDSPLPLEVNYDEESNQNILGALEILLEDCAADSLCNHFFPDLKRRFLNFLADKSKNPLRVSVINPQTNHPEFFFLKGKDLISVFTAVNTGGVAKVPYEIEKMLRGDLSTIKEQLQALFNKPGQGIGMGMRLSVWCAEEFPFVSQSIIQQEENKYPTLMESSPELFSEKVCNIWAVTAAPDIDNQAVQSDVPVLLISGSYDHETPMHWAKKMQTNLTRSHHSIFYGWKHTPTTYWNNPCAMTAARAFFNDPINFNEPSCMQDLGKSKFTVQ